MSKTNLKYCIFGLLGLNIILLGFNPILPNYIEPWTKGLGGNLIAGTIQGVMFLLMAIYLNSEAEENIKEIREITEKSEKIIERREELLREEQDIFYFEQFLKRQSYHDVRFPDLVKEGYSLGLEYKIEPVRDPKTNEPRKYETEDNVYWIIKVAEPSNLQVLPEDKLSKYFESPIKEDNYYFCRYINNSWHMGEETPFTSHKFYLSSKMGPTEYGVSANQFMNIAEPIPSDVKMVGDFNLKQNGDERKIGDQEGAVIFKIYKDQKEDLFLTMDNSLLKKIYYTNSKSALEEWKLEITGMAGFVSVDALEKLKIKLKSVLDSHSLEPKKVQWWKTKRFEGAF